ncbi:DUF3299 domain-containing protein [Mariniblastus sp.]|nr:DUF3299 domain-containing protein [Mariniblastus sp.]
MFVAVTVGCSPESRPAADPMATDSQLEVSTQLEAPNSGASTQLGDSANVGNGDESTGDDGDDATKFIGQDGRERIVPTGPPPTDADGRLELTFDDLSFEMEKGGKFDRSMLTDRITKFDGADVRLRGFIRPSFRQSNIEKFVFVRDDKECCFGPGAAIYDNALVSLKKGAQTNYTVRPVVVTGKLHLKEYETPDGMVLSIYRIKNGKIE